MTFTVRKACWEHADAIIDAQKIPRHRHGTDMLTLQTADSTVSTSLSGTDRFFRAFLRLSRMRLRLASFPFSSLPAASDADAEAVG